MDKIILESVQIRATEIEKSYQDQFRKLQSDVYDKVQAFMAESINANSVVSPELQAQVAVYKPAMEAIVKALKDSGVLNAKQHEEPNEEYATVLNECISVINEQTEALSEQSTKIKDLQMRLKLHEQITQHLSGLNKSIVAEAIKKFQGEDIPEDQLVDKLVAFVKTHKPGAKAIQFESILGAIDEVDSILESRTTKNKCAPSKIISIPGLKNRVVNESVAVREPDEVSVSSEVDDFMDEFGHLMRR